MKQDSIFSYVKRNNDNSEGVDGNEQCSSNVKEAPPPKQTKCTSIAKVRKFLRYEFFLPDDQVIHDFQIFVTWGSMTNMKVYQGFHDDKKVKWRCCRHSSLRTYF